jgi:PPM family protein phosphatase
MARMVATWGVATNPGLVRSNNEDAVFAEFPVFVVADGMGGQAGGEVASSLVSEAFRSLAAAPLLTVDDVREAIERANDAVVDAATSTDGLAGMGTTLVGLALVSVEDRPSWLAFNIGDSRCYRFSGGALTQVTTDHSEVQILVDQGAITPEAARSHPHRNVITRAIGAGHVVEPDFFLLTPEPGERFLVCSDGLTVDVEDGTIASVLETEPDPQAAAARLVDLAVAGGGHDNVTVLVVDTADED